jgi:hypothetical protein
LQAIEVLKIKVNGVVERERMKDNKQKEFDINILKQYYEEIKNRNLRDFESWRSKCLVQISKIFSNNSEEYKQFNRLPLIYYDGDFEPVNIRFEEYLKNIINSININEFNSKNNEGNVINIKIFISHSSKDKELMENFVTAITNIFVNLKRNEIFCTSVNGCDIDVGEDIYDFIKKQSNNTYITIGMISKESIKSETVLFEFGLAWGLEKLKPIIIEKNYDFKDLPKPIENHKCLKLYENSDFNKLIDYLERTLNLNKVDSNTIENYRNEFFEKYHLILSKNKTNESNTKIINEFENEWQTEQNYFYKLDHLFNSFDLLFKDSISKDWGNYNEYRDDLPLLLSINL